MKTRLVFGIAIAGLLAVATWSWAQDTDAVKTPTLEERIANQLERMTTRLELTDEQKVQIEAILKKDLEEIVALQEKIRVLHEQMRTEIDGVLTDEQKAQRPDFSGVPRGPRGPLGHFERGGRGGFGYRMRGTQDCPVSASAFLHIGARGILGQLDLTDEQKIQIREILKDRPADCLEAIKAVLTPEQIEKLDELKDARPGRGVRGGGQAVIPNADNQRGRRGGIHVIGR